MRRALLAGLIGALLIAMPALAAHTGKIAGKVTDPDGNPLAGAKITATSPKLQLERTAVTTEGGNFRLGALPPGTYNLKIELEGRKTIDLVGTQVALNKTCKVEIVMLPLDAPAPEAAAPAEPAEPPAPAE